MIKAIMEAAGFPYRRGRFPKPPAGTYAVYMDDQTRRFQINYYFDYVEKRRPTA